MLRVDHRKLEISSFKGTIATQDLLKIETPTHTKMVQVSVQACTNLKTGKVHLTYAPSNRIRALDYMYKYTVIQLHSNANYFNKK